MTNQLPYKHPLGMKFMNAGLGYHQHADGSIDIREVSIIEDPVLQQILDDTLSPKQLRDNDRWARYHALTTREAWTVLLAPLTFVVLFIIACVISNG